MYYLAFFRICIIIALMCGPRSCPGRDKVFAIRLLRNIKFLPYGWAGCAPAGGERFMSGCLPFIPIDTLHRCQLRGLRSGLPKTHAPFSFFDSPRMCGLDIVPADDMGIPFDRGWSTMLTPFPWAQISSGELFLKRGGKGSPRLNTFFTNAN